MYVCMYERDIIYLLYRDVGVAGVALRIGGGEDGVDEDEGADDLRRQARALAVAGLH